MPRRFPLDFRFLGKSEEHYAIIGMAHVADDYPMFYDAVNEKGLAMAGLNFVVMRFTGSRSRRRKQMRRIIARQKGQERQKYKARESRAA